MIIDGTDLMLYVDTSTAPPGSESVDPVWTPTANATSHQVTYNAETKERITKDLPGKWKGKVVTALSVSIKCDALVADAASGYGYEQLLAKMKAAEPVKLKYSHKELEANGKYEEGLFIITSLDQTSQANEDATYSASFENTGEVITETVA